LSRAKAVPKSNEDAAGDDYYEYDSREQSVSPNTAEPQTSAAIETAATTRPVEAANSATKAKNYNYDNINGWTDNLFLKKSFSVASSIYRFRFEIRRSTGRASGVCVPYGLPVQQRDAYSELFRAQFNTNTKWDTKKCT
jgi:hypothetical protein